MTVVGIYDFNMKDFIKPTPERVRRILSAVINFAKFREEQLSEFEKYTSQTDQLTEKKHILEQENHALAEKLHTARFL
jgi:kinetochore protein Nuf2